MLEMYFDNVSGASYLERGFCSQCMNEVYHRGIVCCKYSKSKKFLPIQELFCMDCIEHVSKFDRAYEIVEKRLVIVDEIPSTAFRIFLVPPQLKNSRNEISVYDVAEKQISDEVVIDKTVLAGRDSIDPFLLERRKEELRLIDDRLNKEVDWNGL